MQLFDWLAELATFLQNTIFTYKNDRQTNDSYSDWGYLVEHFLTMNKVSLSTSKKENGLDLLPMIKLELSSENGNFRKTLSATMHAPNLQRL